MLIPWRSHLFVVAALALACGGGDGDHDGGVDARAACRPPASALPTSGPLIHPDEVPVGVPCVPGGPRELPGRWFVTNPNDRFSYFYPRFEGDCATGFRLTFVPDDADPSEDLKRYSSEDLARFKSDLAASNAKRIAVTDAKGATLGHGERQAREAETRRAVSKIL